MADVARADRLRALRKAHRLTQPAMAEIAGVTLRAYQAWESEKKPGGIEWEHAKALGRHFEVDPEALVRRRDEDPLLVESSEIRAQLDRIEQRITLMLEFFNITATPDGQPELTYRDAYATILQEPATPAETATQETTPREAS